MLEFMVAFTCAYGNGEGCTKSAEAYYRYKKFDAVVERFKRQYKTADMILTPMVTIASVANQKAAVMPLYQSDTVGDFKLSVSINQGQQGMIVWKKDY